MTTYSVAMPPAPSAAAARNRTNWEELRYQVTRTRRGAGAGVERARRLARRLRRLTSAITSINSSGRAPRPLAASGTRTAPWASGSVTVTSGPGMMDR
jgi:hypothetical protein